jgi:hypothetical protein
LRLLPRQQNVQYEAAQRLLVIAWKLSIHWKPAFFEICSASQAKLSN